MPDDLGKPTSPYTRSYLVSVAAHVAVLLVLAVVSAINGCQCIRRQKKLPPIPIEFTVAIPEEYLPSQPEESHAEANKPEPPDAPEAIRLPEPEKPEPKKPKSEKPEPKKPEIKPEPKKPKFEKSTKIVQKKQENKPKEIIKNLPPNVKTVKEPKGPKLTAEEIQKLLDLGAKPGETTSVPGKDEISLLAIKNALYNAWIRPSVEHYTGRPVEIEITLGVSGAVLGYRVVQTSGSRVFDNSALDAAAAVRQIPGLSPEFLRSHRKVTIAFQLEL